MSKVAETLEYIVNGIDTNRIVELATSMAQDDNFGQFRFRANNHWIDGSRSQTSIKDFFAGGGERTERTHKLVVDADQPVYLGGQNTAPNAVEHYLHALVSCLSTTIVAHASVRGIPLKSLRIGAEGGMDARGFFGVSDDVNRGYEMVSVDIQANTAASEEILLELIRYSPVYELVAKAIPVEMNISIE